MVPAKCAVYISKYLPFRQALQNSISGMHCPHHFSGYQHSTNCQLEDRTPVVLVWVLAYIRMIRLIVYSGQLY